MSEDVSLRHAFEMTRACRPNRAPSPALVGGLTASVLLLLAGGCLNDEFFNQMSGGSLAPLAPGDTGFVVAHVVNATSEFTLNVQIGFDAPTFFPEPAFATLQGIESQSGRGIVLPCPLREVGLGDLEDPASDALTIIFPAEDDDGTGGGGGGGTDEPGQISAPAAAFPVTLRDSVDFVCGDTVLFTVIDAPNAPFQVNVFTGRVDGSTQTDPAGPDTFANLQLVVLPFQGPITPVDEE